MLFTGSFALWGGAVMPRRNGDRVLIGVIVFVFGI